MTTSANETTGKYYENIRYELIRLVPDDAMNIVELGCAEGHTGAALGAQFPGRCVYGVELVPAIAESARTRLDEVACLDLDREGLPQAWQNIDCILCGDVLEHLADPWSVVGDMVERLRPGGSIVASIPNVQHHSVVLPLLRGKFEYQPEGVLDRTHLRFFTNASMREMFERAGLTIEHEEALILISSNRSRKRRWKRINRLLGGRLTPFFTLQWIWRCRRG